LSAGCGIVAAQGTDESGVATVPIPSDAASREAGLKYLLLGAFASAFLLYGIALIYGATGGTRLAEIAQAVRAGGEAGTNPLLWAGVAAEIGLLLAIVYTPLGQATFGTAPIEHWTWGLVALLACGFGVLEELRKVALRR
jgi:NADH-quinone oxidoreductase subunit N